MRTRLVALVASLAIGGTLLGIPASAAPGTRSAIDGSVQPSQALAPAQVREAAVPEAKRKARWRPVNRAFFNNPYAGDAKRFRIEQYLIKAIKNTPKNGIIRISLYSWDRQETARALVRARKRGVQVQVLLNDHQTTKAMLFMRKNIGGNPRKKNFVYWCNASCRARRDNLHSKFLMFSRTGGVEDVVVLGSNNFTLNAVKWQWNDMLSMTKQEYLTRDLVKVFNDMRKDYNYNRPYWTFCGNKSGKCNSETDRKYLRVFPRNAGPKSDPVLQMLKPIKCLYQSGGKTKRTKIRVSMHTMKGGRGDYLAKRMRGLWAAGCDIKVIYGLMGWHTKQALGAATRRGRIPLRSTGFDYNGDLEVDRYTHHKYATISGFYAGKKRSLTFTGSSNWSNRGTYGDEIIFKIAGSKFVRQYNGNFGLMFSGMPFTRNAYTTTASVYRVPVKRVLPDGTTYTGYTHRTVERTVNRPDALTAGGSTWEND